MLAVLIVGLAMNAVALPLAGRRVWFLYRLITSGQPAPDRVEGVTSRLGAATKRQAVEVLGQRKLLKWSVPGAAHFFVFWAFLILATVYLEAYGSLLKLLFHGGDAKLDWAIPVVGHWWILGFAQDFIAMMAFFGIVTFVVIRIRQAPARLGRRSRFSGSHLSGAWITLFMIFNVIWTMYLFRGASAGLGNLPYKDGAFVSIGLGKLLDGISNRPLEALEGVGLILHIGVMLVFLIFVLNSKHLHIFLAPLNVLFGRPGVALGAATPLMSAGKPIMLDDLDDLDEDAKLGVGAVEDFSWKGILDFNTCTECGRCQDQCPAWNTEKPLSPKLLIMALRDHAMAKAPYLLAGEDSRQALLEGNDTLTKEVERPIIGDESVYGVIDPDVLWSCVTCGACVQQCPVDIEHVDHIIDMRRYQVLVESNFPAELNQLFKGLENKGNPWNMSPNARLDWAKDLPFDVKVIGGEGPNDPESLDEVDWLFWVGCAGAYEDRAKKTTRAVAELLDLAGVNFAVLGNGETCTGDSARRAGNEFVFQGLATQNVETFKERKVKKVVSTCAHCFNTLKNEYQEFGIELEVVHHTQLLNRLVREKKLTPVATVGGPGAQPPVSRTERQRRVTYHDPCYLGRHNQVYSPPRELLAVIPDADFVEMPRNSERSFCCGAGGARMWMEETIGTRINTTRTKEAVETGADQIAVGCPFCRVMLSDGLTEQQSKGEAREEVEVLDVAQMLLASIKGEAPARRAGDKKPEEKAPAKTAAKSGEKSVPSGSAVTATQVETAQDEATKAEPDADDTTQTEETVTAPADVGPAAKASGGSSLFDLGDDADEEAPPADEPAAVEKAETEDKAGETEDDAPAEPEEPAAARTPAGTETTSAPADSIPEGGSLFDIEAPADEPAAKPTDISDGSAETKNEAPESEEQPAAAKTPATSGATSTPADSIPEGGSLFDIEAPAEEPAAEPAPAPPNDETPADAPEDTAGDSTTDGVTDRSEDDADTDVEPTDAGSTDGTSSEPEPESGEDGASSEAPQVRSSPDGAIPGTSMFDLEARTEEPASSDANASDDSAGGHPAPEDPTGDSTTDGDTDRAEDAVDTGADRTESAKDEPRDEAEGKPEIRSLRDIKAQYAGNETPSEAPGEVSAEDSPAKTEPEAEDDSADEANTAPKPAASGDAHTPRTDAKIDESSSLFDL